MAGSIQSIMKEGSDFLHKAGKRKLIIMGGAVLAIVALGVIGAILLNRASYTVLYSGLSAEESGAVIQALEEMNVAAKAEGTDTILVPEDQADLLRIRLAAEGYPRTGLNYDIFSDASNIAATDSEELTYKQYQLQENMRSTIGKMDKIKNCVVIVNMAVSSSYVVSSKTSAASASILLEAEAGTTLTDGDARAIARFAMTCVPDLQLEDITIVDTEMNYYDVVSGEGDGVEPSYSAAQQELTERMKDILIKQALTVLEPALGRENLAIAINLNLNFDAKTINSVEFSPPVEGQAQGLLRSSEEIYEAIGGSGAAGGAPGTDSNGVTANRYASGGTDDGAAVGNYDYIYNYELNQVQTEIEKARGSVENLSVSVLVNNQIEGVSAYTNTIKQLVANAIGVDPEYITVGMMPFVKSNADAFSDYFQPDNASPWLNQDLLIKIGAAAGGLLLLVGGIILLLTGKRRRQKRASATESLATAPPAAPLMKTPTPMDEAHALEELVIKKSDKTEQVEELMDKYPETVAQILRGWLTED